MCYLHEFFFSSQIHLILSGFAAKSSDPATPQWPVWDMGPIPFRISTVLVHLLLVLLLSNPSTSFRPPVVERSSGPHQPQPSNVTGADKRTCSGTVVCKPGILLPVWLPLNPPQGERAGRAVIYFLCLMYIFMGVSIIADRFMASIEVITSQVWLTLKNHLLFFFFILILIFQAPIMVICNLISCPL